MDTHTVTEPRGGGALQGAELVGVLAGFLEEVMSEPSAEEQASSQFQSICVLVLRWVSCTQHIWRSCFCIHSASLCLLVGTFNPFMFKVIIDKYDPIAIYFIVLSWQS